MYSFTYKEYQTSFYRVFSEDKKQFKNKARLISACQNTIESMINSYIIDKNNVLTSFGTGNNVALAFVYTDERITAIIDTWINDVIIDQPRNYRLSILSASVFLTFLYNQEWLTKTYLDRFYNRYDANKILPKKN